MKNTGTFSITKYLMPLINKKTKPDLKTSLCLGAAFMLPVAVFIFWLVLRKVYPFGEYSLLRMDNYNQYFPFLYEFRRRLIEGDSLFYSLRIGIGGSFSALYFYYLASPLNYLLPLFPQDGIMAFMTVTIIIRIGLAGLSFCTYALFSPLRQKRVYPYAFGLLYAVSGYICAYYWDIMWLDCFWIAPLVILGLEMLTIKGSRLLYPAALFICVFTNYYIAYQICIFVVLYFLFVIVPYLWKEKPDKKLRILRDFVIASLVAGLIACVIIMPGILPLTETSYSRTANPSVIKTYFNIFQLLLRHSVGAKVVLNNDHWPNIYCGVIVMLMTPMYFASKKLEKTQKISSLLILILCIASFSLNVLDYIWHGMNFPSSLPGRWSFLYIFFLVVLAMEGLGSFLDEDFSGKITVFIGAVVLYCILGIKFSHENVNMEKVKITIVLLLVYSLFLMLFKKYFQYKKNWVLPTVLTLCFFSEILGNMMISGIETPSYSSYMKSLENKRSLIETAELPPDEKDGFNRIELIDRTTKNDSMLVGMNTASMFSSTQNDGTRKLYKRMGLISTSALTAGDGIMPLSGALLNVDYMITKGSYLDPDMFEPIEKQNNLTLSECKYRFGMGMVLPENASEVLESQYNTPMELYNDFARALGVDKNLFEPVASLDKKGKDLKFEVPYDSHYYGYPKALSSEHISYRYKANKKSERRFDREYYPYIMDFGIKSQGDDLVIYRSGNARQKKEKLAVEMYSMDREIMDQVMDKLENLQKERTKCLELSDTKLVFDVNLDKDQIFYVSVPAEKGWLLKVDGQRADVYPAGGAFLGADPGPGSHRLEFTWHPFSFWQWLS